MEANVGFLYTEAYKTRLVEWLSIAIQRHKDFGMSITLVANINYVVIKGRIMKIKSALSSLFLVGFLFSGAAQASLLDRGSGMIYDDALNLTWLKDANYSKTSGYDADGLMTWAEADTWARTLNISGITGWRLPATVDFGNDGCNWSEPWLGHGSTDCGYSVSDDSSEMAHLFHITLQNNAWNTYPWASNEANGLLNTGIFDNIQPYFYWSETVYALPPDSRRFFSFGTGLQRQAPLYENMSIYAWAVRDGDVAIPEPGSAVLMGLAIGVLAVSRTRQLG